MMPPIALWRATAACRACGLLLLALALAPAASGGPVEDFEARMEEGRTLYAAGKYQPADASFAEAFRLAEAGGLPAPRKLEALIARLDPLDETFQYLTLRDVTRQILAVQVAAGDLEGAVQTQMDLGYLLTVLNNGREAIPILRDALRYHETRGNAAEAALAETRLGNACLATLSLKPALAHAMAAESFYRRKGDASGLLEVLQVLAIVHLTTGDHEAARECVEEGLSLEPIPLYRATYMSLRSVLLESSGDLAGALRLREEAAACLHELGDMQAAAEEWLQAARLLVGQGRVDEVRRKCDRIEEIGGWHPYMDAALRNRRGDLALALKEPAAASVLYEEGVARASALPDPALVCEGLTGLAASRIALDDLGGARDAVVRALGVVDRMTMGLSPVRAALTGQGGGRRHLFSIAKRTAFLQPGTSDTFDLLERTRAGAVASAADVTYASPADPDLARRHQAAREKFEQSRLRCEAAGQTGRRADVKEATQEYRRDLRDYMLMEELVRGGSTAGREIVGLSMARAELSPGDVLLLGALEGGRLRALVIDPERERVVDLCSEQQAREAAESLLAAVWTKAERVDLDGARARFLDPLALPPGVTRILMSPDGPLSVLPWSLLEPRREVVLVPSATALCLLRRLGGRPGRRILALGAPDCSSLRKGWLLRALGCSGGLEALPESLEEVQAVVRPGDVCLSGATASERGFREHLALEGRWRAIHLACHGFTNLRRPGWTSLILTPAHEEDGFLTLLEVFGLRTPADLVVLSACESGLGREVDSEGILGFPTAFLSAGASRVLASLWKVDSDATRALMTKFHERWNPAEGPGLPAPVALREAQAFVRSKPRWAAPFYWAGWVLWGLPD
ncbi:MAG: CHAT domain-containing tetratricopeptide repeat protein [Planctomycetes bacterium]|jgi:tetratricopeptide (TPR) repeat protein|nr:CHAT domain-containing tetratricopeptide repeat protein [Planctomycetota bacterium]